LRHANSDTIAAMVKSASAVWNGDFKSGSGAVSSASGALSVPYGVNDRFGDGPGTNPEELIAAAHASCFSMAFSLFLQNAGFTANQIETSAKVTFEKVNDAWTLTRSSLTTKADVPGASAEQIRELAEEAKKNCPISRVLNLEIDLTVE
jgi:osmotically inducible protein OsmC